MLSMEEAGTRLAGREDRLSVAVSNSPRSSVISGDPAALQQVMAELERDDVFCRLVKVDVASHSPQMDPLAQELSADLAGLAPGEARIPIWSTVLGRRAEGHEFDAAYWGRNLRQTVRFTDAVSRLLEDGVSIFVELGPHPILLQSVQQTAQSLGREVITVACGLREEGDQAVALTALGQLWAAGYPVEWERVMPERGSTVPLPLYPWQRERYWVEAAEIRFGGARSAGRNTSTRRRIARLALSASSGSCPISRPARQCRQGQALAGSSSRPIARRDQRSRPPLRRQGLTPWWRRSIGWKPRSKNSRKTPDRRAGSSFSRPTVRIRAYLPIRCCRRSSRPSGPQARDFGW